VDEKIHFSQNMYKISSKDLGIVVEILEEKCPKALEKGSPDEVDIVIDAIDNKTFRELEKYILEKVPEKEREPIPTSSKKSRKAKDSSSSKKQKTESS
jgi:major membrane immunogen (membrane-anchored lipoprotein)